MNEENDTKIIVYYPTENDKIIMTAICDEIINLLEPLRLEQKAFALAQLVNSFEDVSRIKMQDVITTYKEGNDTNEEKG